MKVSNRLYALRPAAGADATDAGHRRNVAGCIESGALFGAFAAGDLQEAVCTVPLPGRGRSTVSEQTAVMLIKVPARNRWLFQLGVPPKFGTVDRSSQTRVLSKRLRVCPWLLVITSSIRLGSRGARAVSVGIARDSRYQVLSPQAFLAADAV